MLRPYKPGQPTKDRTWIRAQFWRVDSKEGSVSAVVQGQVPDTLNSEYWRARRGPLFVASCVALIVTAMSFAIRGDIIGQLREQFGLTNQQLGWIAATGAWGFTLSMVIGGPLCDVLGMGR